MSRKNYQTEETPPIMRANNDINKQLPDERKIVFKELSFVFSWAYIFQLMFGRLTRDSC